MFRLLRPRRSRRASTAPFAAAVPLVAVLLAVLGFALSLGAPSRAQDLTGPENLSGAQDPTIEEDSPANRGLIAVHTAIVLDFDIAPGVDPLLGRRAADAVAVEMQRSGNFNVVSRQRMENAVATIPGLLPPYTPPTMRRLGEVLGARSVVTGRVISATVRNRLPGRTRRGVPGQPGAREAAVQLQLRQMEVQTGDFINGTQVTEFTVDYLREVDDEVLMNQSLDKAAYSAVRTVRLITFPQGTVMHTTQTDVELNLGYRDGLRPGQRFSVTRDVANKSRGGGESQVTVQRIKVAELVIGEVDSDSSRAVIAAGGTVGVRTNDKVRRIFAPGVPFTEPTFERGGTL